MFIAVDADGWYLQIVINFYVLS